MVNLERAEQVAKLLLSIQAITFRFDPPYTYTSGMKSPIYVDNRLVMSYPAIRKQIIKGYIELIDEEIGRTNVEWISATASAAIPQGAWVAEQLNLPMVFVRPTTKSYGKENKMEGHLENSKKVLIIEDHVSTAESVVGNAKTIRDLGGKVEYCVATMTYDIEKSKIALNENKIKLITLTTGKIIVDTALKEGQLTQENKEKVDLWLADPVNWAKKVGLE